MSLEEKIAGEFNHFLKIMNHKEEGKPDESLSDDEKRHSIYLMKWVFCLRRFNYTEKKDRIKDEK